MIDLKIGNLYKTTKDTVVHVRHSDDYHQTTWLRNNIVVVVMHVPSTPVLKSLEERRRRPSLHYGY